MINIIANMSSGERRFINVGKVPTYTDGRALACGSLKLYKRRHLATDFGNLADDWIDDAHRKTEFMRAQGVSFFETCFTK